MRVCQRFLSAVLLLCLALSGSLPGQVPVENYRREAKFYNINPVNFYFHRGSYFDRLQLQASSARLWSVFQPADTNPEQKPLFVFFNGGPYAATSSGLLSAYTGRYTLDLHAPSGGNTFIPNPVSWTGMGNLLYIDARTSGFSYNTMINPENYYERSREFDAQNFNMFIDAADFIRVLLLFLEDHPSLRDNPVVIVGESYGGIRATIMLHILLNYRDYGNGEEIYQDPKLVEEIQLHYDRVFPGYSGQEVPPEIIAGQFGHQVLIQPAISYTYQREESGKMWELDGSVIHQIAGEEGLTFHPCPDDSCDKYSNALNFVQDQAGRDPYIYPKDDGWLLGYFGNAGRLLRNSTELQKITGENIRGIDALYAAIRAEGAYKILDTSHPAARSAMNGFLEPDLKLARQRARLDYHAQLDEPGDLETIFGNLMPWDRYFLDLNYDAAGAQYWNIARELGYDIHYSSPRCGRMFLKNVAYVNTLITNARYDLVIYSRALPLSLARHGDILVSAVHQNQDETAVQRTGRIVLTYQAGAFADIPDLTTRTIRFPLYAESCHSVPLTQGSDFYQDISAWVSKTLPAQPVRPGGGK